MELSALQDWNPPDGWLRVVVIDSHAGGEPFRIVADGLPPIPGETMLERRRYATESMDDLRRALMWEPRGHTDMYGGWLGEGIEADSDLSVLFLHNEGFSTMCGHGIIALTKVAVDTGLVSRQEPETTIHIDTPAGQISSTAMVRQGSVESVRFRNVASYAHSLDNGVDVDGIGSISYDLAFGGAYYAYVDGPAAGLEWPPAAGPATELGRRIKRTVVETTEIEHPEHADLGFLYGVIFYGPPVDPANHLRNVCVFADGEIDRSPTGTGVSGHVAIKVARGELAEGEAISVESIIGSVFTGRAVATTTLGHHEALIPEIGGTAHITGRSEFWIDPADPISQGFLVR